MILSPAMYDDEGDASNNAAKRGLRAVAVGRNLAEVESLAGDVCFRALSGRNKPRHLAEALSAYDVRNCLGN
jgi:hypothetical protein